MRPGDCDGRDRTPAHAVTTLAEDTLIIVGLDIGVPSDGSHGASMVGDVPSTRTWICE